MKCLLLMTARRLFTRCRIPVSYTHLLYRLELPDAPYFCTVKLSRKVYPYLKHHRLNDVCDYMGIQLDHHDAGSDARGCALIVANTMNLMQIYEPLELAQTCQIPVNKILD